jgi:hypothetical protein
VNCRSGKKPQWDGDPGSGYAWKQIAAGTVAFTNSAVRASKQMTDQGFTSDENALGGETSPLRLGFYLKDVMDDAAFFQVDPDLDKNTMYWPLPNKPDGVIIDPTPDQCKELVKFQRLCQLSSNKVTETQCEKNLFQRKISLIGCNRNGMFKAGGVLGLKDDYEALMVPGKYGIQKLAGVVGRVKQKGQLQNESLDNKINKILNEEHRKFTFNSKPQPKIEFDKELVETISTQLVISAYFDLQKSMKKLDRLNENAFGSITSGLGFNLGDKLMQGGKEVIAKKIIGYLGFNPDDYISLLLVNIFANLDIADYPKFISDCKKFTAVIVKSALEAWLDKAAKSMGGGSMEGFVYSALKNTVTETAAQTTVFKKLEKLAATMVCPLVEGLADSVKNGSLSLF